MSRERTHFENSAEVLLETSDIYTGNVIVHNIIETDNGCVKHMIELKG
ncbi:MAG: hypothetical protein ACTSSP_05390 [Candidatus Asgardarchaeia archaeon]